MAGSSPNVMAPLGASLPGARASVWRVWPVDWLMYSAKNLGIAFQKFIVFGVGDDGTVIQVEGGFLTQGNLLGQGNDLIVGCCFYSA